MTTHARTLVIVTGLSGAGMSSALKHLEDMGYEVLDNFPLSMIPPLLDDNSGAQAIAIGIDTRTRGFEVQAVIDTAKNIGARLLFLTADEATLQKRFTETRRRHPLAKDRPVSAGIKKEMTLLFPLREASDVMIDTSKLSVHDLRAQIEGNFKLEQPQTLTVSLLSFGFKYGLPREADIVMDVRFLKNPHWDAKLKPLTGQDKAVAAYIQTDPDFEAFYTGFKNLIEPLLPRYAAEGKSYLTIAVGCTGGRHRSVYMAEKLAADLQKSGFAASPDHRDIGR